MSKQSNLMERSQSFFREAARRAVLPLTENELDEFLQRISLVADINPHFASKLTEIFPQQDFRLSNDLATEMASRVRYFLGVDDIVPIFNLPTMLDEKLNVLLFPIEQNRLAGACALIDKLAFIFVSDVAQEDIIFTCAHELAHLIILSARQKNKGGAILDPADNMTVPLKAPHELFADTFAQELLIPNRGLGIALQKIRSLLSETNAVTDTQLLYLARIFGVSLYRMAKKCEKENLLPKGAAAKLNRRLIEKHGGPEKRADEFRIPPRPEIKIASVPYSLELAIIKEVNRSKTSIGATATRTRQKEGISPVRP